MKVLCLLVLSCSVVGGVACSDDSAPGGGSGGGSAGQAGMSSASGAGGGASQAGASASSAGAGQAGASAGASDYCNMYCQCHAANCASTAIPGGANCLDFCAAFPNDAKVKDCRLAMCTLVPAQPNNNHCVHSLGIDECLAP